MAEDSVCNRENTALFLDARFGSKCQPSTAKQKDLALTCKQSTSKSKVTEAE